MPMEQRRMRIRAAVAEMLGVTKIRLVAGTHLHFNVPPEAGHQLPTFLTFMKVCEGLMQRTG